MTNGSDNQKSHLGIFDSVCIIVGIIVGVGIYETSPLIAASLPNENWVIGIWLLGGLLSLAGALCYAELAALYPQTGGDYIYLRHAYGNLFAFLFGWGRTAIIRPGSIAAMAFPFASYALEIWDPFLQTPLEKMSEVIVASLCVLLLTALNAQRLSTGAVIQNFLTLTKVLGLLLVFLIPLLAAPEIATTPSSATNTSDDFGLALILVLFTFGGWSEVAFVAGEVRDPKRNILRILLYGIFAVTLLYLLVNFSFLYALGHQAMAQSDAVAADAAKHVLSEDAGIFISALICVSALGAVQGLIFTGGRISYALGKDFNLLSFLARWDEYRGGPVNALWIQAFLTICIIVLTGSFFGAVLYTSAVVWFFYACVGLTVVIFRLRGTGAKRSIGTLGYPLSVALFVSSCVYLTYSSILYDSKGTLISLGLLLVGVPIYLLSKQREP